MYIIPLAFVMVDISHNKKLERNKLTSAVIYNFSSVFPMTLQTLRVLDPFCTHPAPVPSPAPSTTKVSGDNASIQWLVINQEAIEKVAQISNSESVTGVEGDADILHSL